MLIIRFHFFNCKIGISVYVNHAQKPSCTQPVLNNEGKVLAKGNNRSLWRGSNPHLISKAHKLTMRWSYFIRDIQSSQTYQNLIVLKFRYFCIMFPSHLMCTLSQAEQYLIVPSLKSMDITDLKALTAHTWLKNGSNCFIFCILQVTYLSNTGTVATSSQSNASKSDSLNYPSDNKAVTFAHYGDTKTTK